MSAGIAYTVSTAVHGPIATFMDPTTGRADAVRYALERASIKGPGTPLIHFVYREDHTNVCVYRIKNGEVLAQAGDPQRTDVCPECHEVLPKHEPFCGRMFKRVQP